MASARGLRATLPPPATLAWSHASSWSSLNKYFSAFEEVRQGPKRGNQEDPAAGSFITQSQAAFLKGKEVQLPLHMGRSCALVSCSCAVSRVTGSLGKSLPLLLCPLVDHSLNYPWPKLCPAAIVKCIQLKPVNSLGVKTNCSFWQTIPLLPRISWLCAEWHHSLRARRLFPAAGVGFIGRKPPTFVGKEMHELCRQDCTTSP